MISDDWKGNQMVFKKQTQKLVQVDALDLSL